MIKGYTLPRTPQGISSLLPNPPWHYVGDAIVVEYLTDEQKAAAFLPEGLELDSDRCAVYFMDWQYTSEEREEYLDPVCSQYRETLFLLFARYEGRPIAYCLFIWVSQDKAMMRGLIQGWPKQFGETWITRSFPVPSKAVHELVQLKSRDVKLSEIWKGPASLNIFDHPHTELPDLKPIKVLEGYRFSVACTIDDLALLKDYK